MNLVSINLELSETLLRVRNLMQEARELALSSKSKRRKVGAILVNDKHDRIASGINCIHGSFGESLEDEFGKTKPEVIHAEQSILYQIGSKRSDTTSLFVTTCPCKQCASLITTFTRIYTVCFSEAYRNLDGLELLLADGLVTCLYFDMIQDTLYKIERVESGVAVGHKLAGKGTMTISLSPHDPIKKSVQQEAPWEDAPKAPNPPKAPKAP